MIEFGVELDDGIYKPVSIAHWMDKIPMHIVGRDWVDGMGIQHHRELLTSSICCHRPIFYASEI